MRSKFATKLSGVCLDAAEKMNAPHKTNNQHVILSLSNFHRASSEVKARRQSAAGISLKTSVACLLDVTFAVESHQNSLRDPASAKSLAVLYRIVAASGSLPQQNFDFGRRSYTPPYAQDDIQRFCFAICVRKNLCLPKTLVGAIHESPENERILRTKAGEHSSPLPHIYDSP